MILKVHIPKRLPSAIASTRSLVSKYETSRAFKVFETFTYLKALTPSGKIQQSAFAGPHAFYSHLASSCYLSVNSFKTRLRWLEEWELITLDKYKNIILKSWEQICKQFRVTDSEFYEIFINEQNERLEYVLKTLVIKENKDRQQFKFAQSVSNNLVKDELERIIPGNITSFKELTDYLVNLQKFTYKNRSDSYDIAHTFRADFNVSCLGMARLFDFKALRSSSYLKKVLQLRGFINVKKRAVESFTQTRRPQNLLPSVIEAKPKLNLLWNGKKKSRTWQLCDEITITPALCF